MNCYENYFESSTVGAYAASILFFQNTTTNNVPATFT